MYTLSSPLSPFVPPAAAWADVLAAHGAYGGADVIVNAYYAWCRAYGIDANLALAQACHEATYFTSVRWRTEWNPAGLGITADTTPPNPFRSLDEGIRAHIEHLSCHAYLRDTCPANHQALADRRHFFHIGNPELQDIQTAPFRWAAGVPGGDPLDYVRSIVAIANSVGGGTALADPYDRIHWSADIGPARNLADVAWFVVHDTEGHFAGDEAVLTSPAAPVESAHFILGRVPGQCVYSVPLDKTAWTAGNDALGELAVQVEMSKAPDETGYTDYQYTKLAEIYRWCVSEGMTGVPSVYLGLHPKDDDGGWLPDDPGIIGHAGVPDGGGGWGGVAHHTDPGPYFDWPRFIGLLGSTPTPPSEVEYFPETGHNLGGGFRAYWHTNGGLAIFGFPVTNELSEGGRTAQYFERAVFELNDGKVALRRLGAAAAKAAGYRGPGID